MMEEVVNALSSYLTIVTIVVALFVPSVFISAAVGATVAMIGVIVLNKGGTDPSVVAGWLIAQVGAAVTVTFVRRRTRSDRT